MSVNSNGVSVPEKCNCDQTFSGFVEPSQLEPFYVSNCEQFVSFTVAIKISVNADVAADMAKNAETCGMKLRSRSS